ncbi:MAG TPA: hypothetical protein VKV69_03205 [Actinomycetota bacterium]|nr:hypothetical protein [Actinomycetota bacterium]
MAQRRKPPGPPPGPGQVGKRPSQPGFLLLLGIVWIASGIFALAKLHAGWKLVPGIVFIGIGLLFVRGAATTVVRRSK